VRLPMCGILYQESLLNTSPELVQEA